MINKSIEFGYLILPGKLFGSSVANAGFVCIDSFGYNILISLAASNLLN
jgi:hypothetical protein